MIFGHDTKVASMMVMERVFLVRLLMNFYNQNTNFSDKYAYVSEQEKISATLNANGNILVSWQSNDPNRKGDIKSQLIDKDGNLYGNEIPVWNSSDSEDWPCAICLKDGTFVVTWVGVGVNGPPGVYAQRLDADGATIGSHFKLNNINQTNLTNGKGSINQMSAVALENGDFRQYGVAT